MTHRGVIAYQSITDWYRAGLFIRAETLEEAADIMGLNGTRRSDFLQEMRFVQHIAKHNTSSAVGYLTAKAAANACNNTTCFEHAAVQEPSWFIDNSGYQLASGTVTNHLWGDGPFYVARGVPITHGTYGGIRINLNAQVIRGDDFHPMPGPETLTTTGYTLADSNIVRGLYAAGTCSKPPRGSGPSIQSAGSWGIAAANHIMGRPPYEKHWWGE